MPLSVRNATPPADAVGATVSISSAGSVPLAPVLPAASV
jgi:hypothetical protein